MREGSGVAQFRRRCIAAMICAQDARAALPAAARAAQALLSAAQEAHARRVGAEERGGFDIVSFRSGICGTALFSWHNHGCIWYDIDMILCHIRVNASLYEVSLKILTVRIIAQPRPEDGFWPDNSTAVLLLLMLDTGMLMLMRERRGGVATR